MNMTTATTTRDEINGIGFDLILWGNRSRETALQPATLQAVRDAVASASARSLLSRSSYVQALEACRVVLERIDNLEGRRASLAGASFVASAVASLTEAIVELATAIATLNLD